MFSSMGFTSLSPTSSHPTQLTDTFSSLQLRGSISNSELPTSEFSKKLFNADAEPSAGVAAPVSASRENVRWNPFEDPTPFNQMTEDNIIEAEFDAIRDRNGRSCNCIPNETDRIKVHQFINEMIFSFFSDYAQGESEQKMLHPYAGHTNHSGHSVGGDLADNSSSADQRKIVGSATATATSANAPRRQRPRPVRFSAVQLVQRPEDTTINKKSNETGTGFQQLELKAIFLRTLNDFWTHR